MWSGRKLLTLCVEWNIASFLNTVKTKSKINSLLICTASSLKLSLFFLFFFIFVLAYLNVIIWFNRPHIWMLPHWHGAIITLHCQWCNHEGYTWIMSKGYKVGELLICNFSVMKLAGTSMKYIRLRYVWPTKIHRSKFGQLGNSVWSITTM